MKTKLDHALELTARGFRVFPILPATKKPAPFFPDGRWQDERGTGFTRASSDTETVRSFWAKFPDANIAIAGGDGVCVLDVDGPQGEATLKHSGLADVCCDTLEAKSGGKGGRHFYFKCSPALRSLNRFLPGLDLKAAGGYWLAPGSRGSSGTLYEWANDDEIAPAPELLIEYVNAARKHTITDPAQRKRDPSIAEDHATSKRLAAEWLAARNPAIQGRAGDEWTFKTVAALINDFALSDGEALRLLDAWNDRCQPPWSERDLHTKLRNAAYYASGEYGWRVKEALAETPDHLKALAERCEDQAAAEESSDDQEKRNEQPPQATPAASTPPWETAKPALPAPAPVAENAAPRVEVLATPSVDYAFGTEMWVADRLLERFGDDLRFVPEWSRWYAWDEARGRWAPLHDGPVQHIMLTIKAEIRKLNERMTLAQDNSDMGTIAKKRAQLEKYYNITPASNTCRAAATMPAFKLHHERLDAQPWLLPVASGVVDLKRGELRDPRREDYLTRAAGVTFDADATCPTWERFLERVQPDISVRRFLQRLSGYWLSGSVSEQCLPVFYGSGANGKTTMLETLIALMGNQYAGPVYEGLLVRKAGDQHPTVVADLYGKRFVVSSELGEGSRLDEEAVKRLTGGERLKARRMREDFWEFAPTHKLVLVGNHKPIVRGTDNGIWRRLFLVPWAVIVPKAEQDCSLPDRLLAELPGILNWCIEGVQDYLERGLAPPESITGATDEYRDSEDLVKLFIDEALERPKEDEGPEALAACWMSAAEVHMVFESWVRSTGNLRKAWGQRTLSSKLKERAEQLGLEPLRRRSQHGFKGVRKKGEVSTDEARDAFRNHYEKDKD